MNYLDQNQSNKSTKDEYNPHLEQPITDKDIDKAFYDSFEMMQIVSIREALGAACQLVHIDERFAHQPFSLVFNSIYGSMMHGHYVMCGQNSIRQDGTKVLTPAALLCWGLFDPVIAALFANNVRPLAPVEYNYGPIGYYTLFTSPFAPPDQMIELMRKKSEKLESLKAMSFVDKLFKPDYNFRTKSDPFNT